MNRPQPLFLAEEKTNSQSVRLGDKIVNLSALSRGICVNQSYLSKVFNGKRQPSLALTMKIAGYMSMTIDELVGALDDRKRDIENAIEAKRLELQVKLLGRAIQEDEEDIATLVGGGTPKPRLPGGRLPKALL